ncbi:MAG: peptide-methionine (S)-S-oxide reductase MsrA [Wenzhouxiangellaceae bacterium]|nr:peptide-methionine (S)-S-oxide reductase MsrA [Wenzhouxiangellaceae bacterium]
MRKTATFAAGCFWGPEARFHRLDGVVATQVGYTGGKTANPDYRQVCSGQTGHAEAVQVVFDPERISYEALLEAFWDMHDPTQQDRQGPDIGSQYRSAIFVHDEQQRQAAEQSRQLLEALEKPNGPIATTIEPIDRFWPAEEYHQRYLEKHR